MRLRLDWLKRRQTKYGAYLGLYLLVVLAALTAANWLANRHNRSWDSTKNKRFSLADQTIKIVRGLKQDVRITYYDETRNFERARDLLDRYDNLSTRLTVGYVDPYKKPQVARAAGIKSIPTIVVEAGPKREETTSLTEEQITSALIRALKSGERNVCFVKGSGEHLLDDTGQRGYSSFKDLLERNNYKTREISLLEKPEVPSDCTILVIAGPRYDYPEPQVQAVKKYLEGGGRVLFMLDPPLRMGKEEVSENPGLTKLLADWGVTLEKNLVLDTSGIGSLFGLGPEVPLVANYEYHAIVREMKGTATAFPIARSVETKSVDKVTVDKLFSTTSNSYATTNLSSVTIRLDPSKDKKGPFNLAAAGTYNTGKENQNGRFVVVGSSDWVSNYILRFQGNRDLAMNMVNWLSSDEDLISIRPKEPEDRRLTLTRAQMRTVFYTSVVVLPLVVVAAGFSVWWRRR